MRSNSSSERRVDFEAAVSTNPLCDLCDLCAMLSPDSGVLAPEAAVSN
jgi:hypothetical protein